MEEIEKKLYTTSYFKKCLKKKKLMGINIQSTSNDHLDYHA